MSALIRLLPMPDELSRGYMMRLMRANGYISESHFFRFAARQFGGDLQLGHELTKIELLAAIAALSPEKFVMNHSTLPLSRSITSSFSEVAHGSTDNRQILTKRAMATIRSDAYFCAKCARSDIKFHGFSYWRRSLQVPGVLWCAKHELPLCYFEYEKAMRQSPDDLCETGDTVDVDFAREALANCHVQRFFAIASGLMDHKIPLSTEEVRLVLRDQATAMGLQSGAGLVRKPLLSDLISNSFPKRWLWTVFPDVAEKSPGEFMYRVDGIFGMSNGASSVWPYILATAVLFDAPDQALNALFATRIRTATDSNVENQKRIRTKKIAEISSAEWRSTRQRSIRSVAGAPSKDLLQAAYMFYVQKHTLSESALLAAIDLEELETFVREISPTFIARLIFMASNGYRMPPSRRSAKGLSPKQIIAAQSESIQGASYSRETEFQN